MKGLLLKDYFAIKSSMIILLIGFVVFGFGVSFYAPPYVLMLIASIILGQFVTTTIYSDRKCGWLKSSITFPTSKKSHVSSKYIMYALLCLLGVVVGLVLSIIITSIRNELDTHLLLLFTCMTTTMIFMSGAVLIPCYYFIKEELSGAIGILAYGISGVFFFGMIKLIENHVLALTISIFTAIILFVISRCFLCQQIINRDI